MAGPVEIRAAKRPIRVAACLAVLVASLALLAAPAGARSSRTQAVGLASSVCASVSPAAVSALVGYTVPAATLSLRRIPATSKNHGISAVVTTCTFGTASSMKAVLKDVTLVFEVTSRSLTLSAVESDLKAAVVGSTMRVSVTTYPSFGVPAVYLTESGDGIKGTSIAAFVGTHEYSATVLEPIAPSKLAALAKLAASI